MDEKLNQLVDWLHEQALEYEEEMADKENEDDETGYSYAQGAMEAYEFVIKHLTKENK
jgi:hypothetical protein